MQFKSLAILLIVTSSLGFGAFGQDEASSADTLRVYQNDPLVFNKVVSMNSYKCWHISPFRRLPLYLIRYELIDPKDSTYYFIYNEEQQLVEEGVNTSRIIDSVEYKDLFDSINYRYHKGKLHLIDYTEDGHWVKREFYNRIGKLRENKTVYY